MPDLLVKAIPYDDPVRLFQPLAALDGAVLLHSAKQGAELGRYSYFAADPFERLRIEEGESDALATLSQRLQPYRIKTKPELPPFQGGAIGLLSFELLQQLEAVPKANEHQPSYPLLSMGLYDVVVSFDHERQQAWVIASGLPEPDPASRSKRAAQRLDWMLAQLALDEPIEYGTSVVAAEQIIPNISRPEYLATIQRTIEYIFSGDIFEVNIAQRFRAPLSEGLTAWQLFARSCKRNAATFASYLNLGDIQIASASPERFIKVQNGQVECRPIKGTRPRSDDPLEDARLAQELCASEKDWAENIMIVDLMRNDIAQVCTDASVQATQLCALESYATVHHLVSVVQGQLREDCSAIDLLRATFPGGSITGAPKIRSMEIIAELEPDLRGPYCGNMVCLGFDGYMDSSILIRTFVVRDGEISFHAGGAIVADSDPEQEYQECLDKTAGLVRVLTQGGVA